MPENEAALEWRAWRGREGMFSEGQTSEVAGNPLRYAANALKGHNAKPALAIRGIHAAPALELAAE